MDIVERLARSQKITEEIVQTDDYINWLENFTIKNKAFSDDTWLYFPDRISEEDNEQVSKLSNFYEAIENYASANFIYPTPDEFGNHYRVSNNNIGYDIGIMMGQGALFWVSREKITKKNQNSFIDFELIRTNKKTDREDMIRSKLDSLDNFIIDLANEDVPVEAIAKTANRRLQLLMEKK